MTYESEIGQKVSLLFYFLWKVFRFYRVLCVRV